MQQYTHCLFCHQSILLQINWRNLLQPNKLEPICSFCRRELYELNGNRCKKCSRETELELCSDCKEWLELYDGEDPLERNFSVYSYNEWMKEVMTRWKYQGDYVIGNMFQHSFQQTFHKNFNFRRNKFIVVPIPLSDDRLNVRGFNQAEMLASFLTKNIVDGFVRISSEKQAKKSKYERMKTKNPFHLTKRITKPVVLIDDIYTTGRTIRHAASLLRKNGCPRVYSYTLIRG